MTPAVQNPSKPKSKPTKNLNDSQQGRGDGSDLGVAWSGEDRLASRLEQNPRCGGRKWSDDNEIEGAKQRNAADETESTGDATATWRWSIG